MTKDSLQAGLVVAHLGQGLAVETDSGHIIPCHTRRQLGGVAVGDRVSWLPAGEGQGRVEKVLPRRTVLQRPSHGGKTRAVAANLDQVLVVLAPEPDADLLLADQILAVCEHGAIGAALVVNKCDLPEAATLKQTLTAEFGPAGYTIHALSTRTGEGLEELRVELNSKNNLLAGQSGVGKSSITRTLLPDRDIRVGQISDASGLGRHTTTTATLYHLPCGGNLIDSPGVAIFGLAEMTPRDLAWGYREFRPHIARCRYTDCLHTDDAGCAVREAAQQNAIPPARYLRYLKLLDKLPKPYPKSRRA